MQQTNRNPRGNADHDVAGYVPVGDTGILFHSELTWKIHSPGYPWKSRCKLSAVMLLSRVTVNASSSRPKAIKLHGTQLPLTGTRFVFGHFS
jgi:hypothetical protein